MDPQTIFLPAKPRVPRKRRPVSSSAAPVGPLMLVSATYDAGELRLTLTFGRAVDLAGADVSQISVSDGAESGYVWFGDSVVSQPTPASVVLALTEGSAATGPTVLNATEDAGIVAEGDGAHWAGVTELGLPYP
jgi:hypothetical protein